MPTTITCRTAAASSLDSGAMVTASAMYEHDCRQPRQPFGARN
jgi:hypothetical protein